MQIKNGLTFLLVLTHLNGILQSQKMRCQDQPTDNINSSVQGNGDMSLRQELQFKLVFHILYKEENENISDAQIYSQIQVLNNIFADANETDDLILPAAFRNLKKTAGFHFCLAHVDPDGQPTTGITRSKIQDLSIACKREFGKRSIMHRVLGGVDIWDPAKFINVYVVNREQCAVLGEAIYPWNANAEEDGIILDFRSVGYSGQAAKNRPFHEGKTLVHELGHFFGLLHLSGDANNCSGNDFVEDTPPQSMEYYGCPDFPVSSCTTADMFMNYMSYVDDDCMHFFTKGQVERMRDQLAVYRLTLSSEPCSSHENQNLTNLYWTDNGGYWVLSGLAQKEWSAALTLFAVDGRYLWHSPLATSVLRVIPQPTEEFASGFFLLRMENETESRMMKLIKY